MKNKWTAFRLLLVFAAFSLCACASRVWQERLRQGADETEQRNYSAAVIAYSEAVDAAPDRPEGYLGRANAYAAQSEAEGTEEQTRDFSRRAAMDDYRKVLELDDKQTEARQKLAGLYLQMGDEAVAAGSDGTLSAALYDLADGYYRSALSLDYSNAGIYQRLAALLLGAGEAEQAAAILEQGVAASHNQALAERLETLKQQLAERKETDRHSAAMEALPAYYGSPAACRMTARQALAYAKILADGFSGAFPGFSGYGKPLYDYNVCWDEPYPVMGTGSYETDRANVILADFAGDGNPYLLVFSSLVEENSFEVYGWTGEKAARVAGIESYGSSREGVLAETESGIVVLEESWSTGTNSRQGETWHFQNGSAAVTEIWSGTWDPNRDTVRVQRNGEEYTYTRQEWNLLRGGGQASHSWPTLYTVRESPASLQEMIEALNTYANILGGGQYRAVEVPSHSQRHLMAAAMLRRLYALDRLSIAEGGGPRLALARLRDLDGDGAEELIVVFDGLYRAENGRSCQFLLYHWQNGALQEYPGGSGLDELVLVRENPGGGSGRASGGTGGETGILSIGGWDGGRRYVYAFLSHREELHINAQAHRYSIVRDGETSGITEAEYTLLQGRYQIVELLVNFANLPEKRNYEETITALYRIRDAG